jgi:glucokinase
MTYLAGDLGGTKTILGLYDEDGALRFARRYESRSHESLEAIIDAFLGEEEVRGAPRPDRGAFGVAGPVSEVGGAGPGQDRQQARITNLSWEIDTEALKKRSGLRRARLVNDFYAVAAATAFLAQGPAGAGTGSEERLVALNPGARANPRGAIGILGAGTGLGEAIIARSGGEAVILPSEGGHADFAPRDEVEIELLRFLMRRHGGHVSYERVLCGAGLLALYEFFREYRGVDLESAEVRAEIERDRAAAPAVVSRHGLAGTNALCIEALDRFALIFGAEAGNLALKALAVGGVYIGGGIAPKILPKLRDGRFLEGFVQKGRFSGLMSTIPVWVIADGQVGLLGASVLARSL